MLKSLLKNAFENKKKKFWGVKSKNSDFVEKKKHQNPKHIAEKEIFVSVVRFSSLTYS